MKFKKYNLLIFSILILILAFLNGWFSDWLFEHLYIFYGLINISLFVCFCTCLVFVIKRLRNKSKKTIDYLPSIILFITIILTLFFPFRRIKTILELILFENQRNEIIENVKNNKYSYYFEGNIKLPEYKYTSSDGEIYVYQNDNDGTVISFWVYRGMMSESVKLMYSDGGEELIRENESGHPIVSIEKLKDNWYYVKTDY